MSDLSLKEIEVVIDFWHLTIPHESAAKQLLTFYRGLQKECEKLLDEVERLQPRIDSSNMVPAAECRRELDARDRRIEQLERDLRKANSRADQAEAAQKLYGSTAPKDRAKAAKVAAENIHKNEAWK